MDSGLGLGWNSMEFNALGGVWSYSEPGHRQEAMDSFGFLWNPMDSYGFRWIPIDSYGFWARSGVEFHGIQRFRMRLELF